MNHIGNDKSDIDLIIARFFGGNATPDEIVTLREWIEQAPENRKAFFAQQDLWEALLPSFEVTDSDTEKAEWKVLAKAGIVPRGSGFIRKLVVLWSRIAAVVVLPLIAVIMYFIIANPGNVPIRDITLSTDYGCTSKATLPDGTIVWLNANSTLRYPQEMRAESRDVNLQGEAYFDVHADAAHPFIVHTPYISVMATGTEFNVNAYDRDASVTLAEGKVEITDAGKRISLQPGEHLQLENGVQTVCKDVDLNKYCSWRKGVLIFEDEPITNICRRLEQIYHVKFDIDSAITGRTFRFILKGENLSEIMNLFQLTAPVTCITENNSHSADSIDLPQTIRIKPI